MRIFLAVAFKLANRILPDLPGDQCVTSHDGSTNGLIDHFKRVRWRRSTTHRHVDRFATIPPGE